MSSEFRIEKHRTEATLMLTNGDSVRGFLFVSDASSKRTGPERVRDVLNAEPGFFPFEVADEERFGQTVLYNREHVLLVALDTDEEPRTYPGSEVATRREVSMLLTNGSRLTGFVRVDRPRGRDRLSDFARAAERFQYLEAPDTTFIVNTGHVLELTESCAS